MELFFLGDTLKRLAEEKHKNQMVGKNETYLFNGPESHHWLCLSLTHSLTHCSLKNLIDVTLACEHAYSKLVEVVTVADVDVGNSLLQIWKLIFGHKAKILFRLSAQGLIRSLKLKFKRDFETEVCSIFCC